MTPYQRYRRHWKNCTRCSLCKRRRKVVIARGPSKVLYLPSTVVFVGEAPGVSEDVIGRPFVGPAGILLDEMIEEALEGRELRYALTNLIACIPRDAKGKMKEPPEKAIEVCKYRLREFLVIAKPKLIVAVGRLAEAELKKEKKGNLLSIIHPAAILRAEVYRQGLAVQRTIETLRVAFRDFTNEEE